MKMTNPEKLQDKVYNGMKIASKFEWKWRRRRDLISQKCFENDRRFHQGVPPVFQIAKINKTTPKMQQWFPKSPQRCEKWILYNFLHRFSGPKNFSTQKSPMKNIILKSEKLFFRTIPNFIKAKKYFL